MVSEVLSTSIEAVKDTVVIRAIDSSGKQLDAGFRLVLSGENKGKIWVSGNSNQPVFIEFDELDAFIAEQQEGGV